MDTMNSYETFVDVTTYQIMRCRKSDDHILRKNDL
jgi:hypothetical protein